MTPAWQYENPRTAAFRATLDLLPDAVALAIGLHVYDDDALRHGRTCVCGWAVREAIARQANVEADAVSGAGDPTRCTEVFGGSVREWQDIWYGTIQSWAAPLIEEALFDRVMAAAEASV